MPNSTPAVGNGQSWGEMKFEGPIGQLKRDASIALGEMAGDITQNGLPAVGGSISNLTQRVSEGIKNSGNRIGGVAAQALTLPAQWAVTCVTMPL